MVVLSEIICIRSLFDQKYCSCSYLELDNVPQSSSLDSTMQDFLLSVAGAGHK